jgi:hypothetical protein
MLKILSVGKSYGRGIMCGFMGKIILLPHPLPPLQIGSQHDTINI